MSLTRRWANGVASMQQDANGNPYLGSADAAFLDANIQRALDKSYLGGTVASTLTLGTGGILSLDSPTASFHVTAPTSTAAGGRIYCGDNDYLEKITTVEPYSTFLEMISNVAGGAWNLPIPVVAFASVNRRWYIDTSTGGLVGGTQAAGSTPPVANSILQLPLTRMHDGASLQGFNVTFQVSPNRGATLPGRYPGINLYQYDPFLNVLTSLTNGWQFFPTPANMTAYKHGGAPNAINAIMDVTVDVGQFLYFLQLLDEDYASEANDNSGNEFYGCQPVVATQSMRFQ